MRMDRWKVEGDVAACETKHGTVLVDVDDLGLFRGMELDLRRAPGLGSPYYARLGKVQKGKRKRTALHRAIMLPLSFMEVDHINHDTLDNRKANLRICTKSENARNNLGRRNKKNPYKGVCFATGQTGVDHIPWRAYTRIGGKRKWLGYYATPELAAAAYDEFALETFGQFAKTNSSMGLCV